MVQRLGDLRIIYIYIIYIYKEVEKLEFWCPIRENVNWYSCCREEHGSS